MRVIREIVIIIISFFALLYLFVPSLIPDLIPFVGWLDEGIATTIVLSALRHYGLDLSGLFGSNYVGAKQGRRPSQTGKDAPTTQTVRISRADLERALNQANQRPTTR